MISLTKRSIHVVLCHRCIGWFCQLVLPAAQYHVQRGIFLSVIVSHGATILELLPRKEQSDLFWLHSHYFGQVFFGLENRYPVTVRHSNSPSRQAFDIQWTPRIWRLAIKTIIPYCFLKVEALPAFVTDLISMLFIFSSSIRI